MHIYPTNATSMALYNQCYTKSKWYDYAEELNTWLNFNNDAVIRILPIDYITAGNLLL